MRTEPENTVSVTIQRVGGESITVSVAENTSVADVLDAAGVMLAESESVFYNGEPITNRNTALVDDGDALQIVQNKKGGARA